MSLDFWKHKSKENIDINENIKKAKQIALDKVRKDELYIQYLDQELKEDLDIIIAALKQNRLAWQYLTIESQKNTKVIMEFINLDLKSKKVTERELEPSPYLPQNKIHVYDALLLNCIEDLEKANINEVEEFQAILKQTSSIIGWVGSPELYLEGNIQNKLHDLICKRLNETYNGQPYGDYLISYYLEHNKKLNSALCVYIANKKYKSLGLDKYPSFIYDKFIGGYVDNENDLNVVISMRSDEIDPMKYNLQILYDINHEFAHVYQFIKAKENSSEGKYWQSVLNLEKKFKTENYKYDRYYWDMYLTEYDADIKSYYQTKKSLQSEYQNSKSKNLIDTLNLQYQRKIEAHERVIKDILIEEKFLSNQVKPPVHSDIENYLDLIYDPNFGVKKQMQNITEIPMNWSYPEFSSDLDKLIWAIETTENKFRVNGDEAVVDLGNYLRTGNLNVFTETNGARKLMESVDYKNIKDDVKIRIAENTIKALKNGVTECSNSVINQLLKRSFMKYSSLKIPSIPYPFELEEELENLLSQSSYQSELSEALTGNIMLKKRVLKNKELPPKDLYNSDNVIEYDFKLGDPNHRYTKEPDEVFEIKEFFDMINGMHFEIEELKYAKNKKSVFDDYRKRLEEDKMKLAQMQKTNSGDQLSHIEDFDFTGGSRK